MSQKYTLYYFSVRAFGEPIRMLLSYGGQEFEDRRMDIGDWEAMKKDSPFGKLPILKIGDKTVHQSGAICRHLARKFDLVGGGEWNALQADIVVDTINDFKTHVGEYFKHVFYGGDEETKKKKMDVLMTETLPFYLPRLEKIVKDNSGHFVNGKLTWADIYWAAHADSMVLMLGMDILQDYPLLQAVQDRVLALPGIKEWVEKRVKTDVC